MQIVLHIGAMCTDDDRLLRSLTRDADRLAEAGVLLPNPQRYRKLLRETIAAFAPDAPGGPLAAPRPGTRESLLAQILDAPPPAGARMILSNPTFLCMPARIFEGGLLYGMAGFKLDAMTRIFAGDAIEIHLACRNPATFIPATFAEARGPLPAFLGALDPRLVRWSDLVARIRAAAPQARLVVWCNEDTPLLWSGLLRRLAGPAVTGTMAGDHDLLTSLMSPEGMQRYLAYLGTHPGLNEAQTRRVIAAFLEKHALPGAMEQVVDLPGWDEALVARLTELYDADMAQVAAMPGVEFLAP